MIGLLSQEKMPAGNARRSQLGKPDAVKFTQKGEAAASPFIDRSR